MATRTLAELVAEQNKLAQAKAPQRPATTVRVLVANRYSGPDLKAVRAQAGDVIAVAGGRYADELVAQGLVEIPVIEEPNEDISPDDPDLAALSMKALRVLAKEAGINSFGMKKATLVEALLGDEEDDLDEDELENDLDEVI